MVLVKVMTKSNQPSATASADGQNARHINPDDWKVPIRDERLLLPQKCCALVFGVSRQAIAQWPVEAREKKGRIALYYLPDLASYREFTISKHRDLDLQEERARLAAAQADRTELEVKQLKGELIPADEILANWEPIVGAARAKVLAIPSKAKTAIPKLNDKDLAKIKRIVRGVLEDLANGGIPKRARVETRVSK